jgi:uncharacterized RDD family membrane protein YckC
VNCPACGFSNSPTAHFCLKCQTPLAPQVPALSKRLLDLNLVHPSSGLSPSREDELRREQGIAASAMAETAAKTAKVKPKIPVPGPAAPEAAGALWDREFVRPGQEENAPPRIELTEVLPPSEHHSLIERTLQKIKRAQVGAMPQERPALISPESTPELPTSPTPIPRKTRRTTTDSNRIERIEINLNQPLLPFDATDQAILAHETPQVSRGLAAASLSPRLLAGLIDLSFLTGSFLIFLLIVRFVPDFLFSSRSALFGLVVVFVMMGLGYLSLFVAFQGKTLGMDQQNLRVVDFHGRFPDPRQSVLRALGCLISCGCFGLGFLWSIFDAEKLSWHDRISGTLIVPQLSSDYF